MTTLLAKAESGRRTEGALAHEVAAAEPVVATAAEAARVPAAVGHRCSEGEYPCHRQGAPAVALLDPAVEALPAAGPVAAPVVRPAAVDEGTLRIGVTTAVTVVVGAEAEAP